MLKSINIQDLRQKMATAIDNRVRIITAGLGINELRAVLRGDPPTEKPNPRYKVHTTSFLFHIRPRYYHKGSTILSHTFRLGFFTFFFFMVELITGLVLMVYYSPTPSEAYTSILEIMSDVPFGNLMRDLHRIGAEAMVIFTFLHMLRTYLLHVILLPLAAILVISIHYYKVAREHGISLPARLEEGNITKEKEKDAKQRLDLIPDLLSHEVYLTILGLFLLFFVTIYFYPGAPLEHIANPQQTPLDTKAPWYFWWLQGMLKLGDKTLMGIIIPTLLVGLLFAVPYIDRNPNRSFIKRPVAVSLGILGVLILIALSYMGLPQYGIEPIASTRIIQDIAPEEGSGPLYEVPFDQLQQGVYVVNGTPTDNLCPEMINGCPALATVFADYSTRVNKSIQAGDLPTAEAVMINEDWQENLKKVTLRLVWDDKDTGETKTYFRHIYIHRDRGRE